MLVYIKKKSYLCTMNILLSILCFVGTLWSATPIVTETASNEAFPLVDTNQRVAPIYYSENDYPVVAISAQMFADDIERVATRPASVRQAKRLNQLERCPAVIAGTIGHSHLIDELIAKGLINTDSIAGRWEASLTTTIVHPRTRQPLLVIAGSDRRGTAFGLTALCRLIGVSPWYWWADVTPTVKEALYLTNGTYIQHEPLVRYRGIFINDERFGGWAQWVEQSFDKETGQVGPKVYEKVFELLLRLRANYLWPAMHNGSKAFNANSENARLADKYAIVMGSSHCEQMLRNNEDEWKNAGIYGDFNYITNRQTMLNYWEERLKTNGKYENTYTLGLRGIHDYPMEGAQTTEQRVQLMQQAIDDQRELIRRNINQPIEQVPQVLCTYEEVLEAYHAGLQVPEDVTLLWSDDKQGYTRNLSNEEEMRRSGGAGIYYHLSYHGDPASWIWLSPLSPTFVATELNKAYRYGAQRIWIFNVGDIKPAEKEISFVMDMAWDIDQWTPNQAHRYIYHWASETFGADYADEISALQAVYYRLMASGKESHIQFIEYPKDEIIARIHEWKTIAVRAQSLAQRIPKTLREAYFELILYPIRGAQMLNEMQLLSRLSLHHASLGEDTLALQEGERVVALYDSLNEWTRHYNEDIADGKWEHFFNWRPYHWYYSDTLPLDYCTPATIQRVRQAPQSRPMDVAAALSDTGATFVSEKSGDIDLWIRALSPVRRFSKLPEDNVFGHVQCGEQSFDASATVINNVWHTTQIGPAWHKVGTLHVSEGKNTLRITHVPSDARIDAIYLGLCPPFPEAPALIIPLPPYSSTPLHPYTQDIPLHVGRCSLEVRTLPTLHLYEGRGARFAIQFDDQPEQVFDIHEKDFSAEWRLNVMRGYATRSITATITTEGTHRVRVYPLDPGVQIQQIRIYGSAAPTPREQLIARLRHIQSKGYMYGHQDDPFYGATWAYEPGRSDTKDAVGDYPGIMGFDLGGLEVGDNKNLDSVPFELMREEIIRQHERGGVITLSWHPRNPKTGGNAWDVSDPKTVHSILPGGENHELFITWLQALAHFFKSLSASQPFSLSTPIPFIFRPWHEYNGSWFWWGEGNCSAEEYKQLWNLTQDYLNEQLPGQIVWANTPNLRTENTLEHFLERWPGDGRVDLLGPDAYQWTKDESQAKRFYNNVRRDLTFMSQYAAQHGLLIALTECGNKNDTYPTWWTTVLQPAVEGFPIVYFLTWRNAPKEHFGALPNSTSTADFVQFYKDPKTLFVRDIRNL